MRTTALALACGACLFGGAAFADTDPDNAIKYRQAVYSTLGSNLTAVVMNLRGEVTFPDAVVVHARTVADTAPLALPAMEQDTAGQGSADTQALDKIWANWGDFTRKHEEMESAAVRLAEIAASGDMQALGGQVQTLAGTCKSCHDEYRD
jgi:cytochrome c556